MSAIERAVEIVGSQMQLAETLGVTKGQVNNWVHGREKVTLLRCAAIEEATQGRVRREELRPDINWDALYMR